MHGSVTTMAKKGLVAAVTAPTTLGSWVSRMESTPLLDHRPSSILPDPRGVALAVASATSSHRRATHLAVAAAQEVLVAKASSSWSRTFAPIMAMRSGALLSVELTNMGT